MDFSEEAVEAGLSAAHSHWQDYDIDVKAYYRKLFTTALAGYDAFIALHKLSSKLDIIVS